MAADSLLEDLKRKMLTADAGSASDSQDAAQ